MHLTHRHYTKDAVAVFLAARTAKGLSPHTLKVYKYRLDHFARNYPRLPSQAQDIEAFLSAVGPSLENRETYYRLLRNFYNVLLRKKLVKRNPVLDIEAPKIPRKVARSLTPAELTRLLMASHSTQLSAFLYLLADTGVRLSEALSVSSIDIRQHTVIVRGKTGERELPISPVVAGMVLEALPWPWGSGQAAGLAVRKAFRRAGITGKRASAHSLRHSFARAWRGDETLLVGIMGWTSHRMLRTYRPFDLDRAVAQHRGNSPVRLAQGMQGRLVA